MAAMEVNDGGCGDGGSGGDSSGRNGEFKLVFTRKKNSSIQSFSCEEAVEKKRPAFSLDPARDDAPLTNSGSRAPPPPPSGPKRVTSGEEQKPESLARAVPSPKRQL